MSHRLSPIFVAMCALSLIAPQARSAIFATSGAMSVITAPVSLVVGGFESSTTISILDEGAKFLPITVVIDVAGPGTFDATPGTPSSILTGTFVHTYLVHFDPVGDAFATLTGGVTFDPGETIAGIQILPASLDMSQVPPIPHPSATYPTGLPTRGFEFLPGTDTVTIAPGLDSASFTLFAELGVDQARIFTVTVPEPARIGLLTFGLILAGGRRRRRKMSSAGN